MPILTAAVIIVGILCLSDLILTFGVIRRLREQGAILSGARGERPAIGLAPGEAPGPFAITTSDGKLLTSSAGLRLVAFFSSSCSICPERVPPFMEYVRANHLPRETVLAVVLGTAEKPAPYMVQLTDVAQVCAEAEEGQLATAFQVAGYPAFCLMDAGGALLKFSYDPASLPAQVVA